MQPRAKHQSTRQSCVRPRLAVEDGREALSDVFCRYRTVLHTTALRLLGNHADAEDALQDAMLAAFRNLSGFKGRSQLSTWLTRIVVNAALMRLRAARVRVAVSIDQESDQNEQPLAYRIPDPRPNPEETYARKQRFRIFSQRLQALPAAHQRAVWLRDIQGMTTREAAEALSVPAGTLKSQLYRGRLGLRKAVLAGPGA